MSSVTEVRPVEEPEPASPWDETVINGTPYEACRTLRRPSMASGTAVETPDTRFAEALKRRQLEAMRAR